MKKLFKLTWKKLLITIMAWITAVVLHNAFYAIFGFEEAVLFILAVIVIPLYLLIAVVYTAIKKFL